MAADFNKCIGFTRKWEGGYSNVPGDTGGETYAGISRKYNPDWDGWELIDSHKPLRNGQIINDEALEARVNNYYRRVYWNAVNADTINDDRIAGFVFDWYVNAEHAAIRTVQKYLCLTADGNCGPATVAAINEQKPPIFINILKVLRRDYYQGLAAANPTDQKFLAGWLNRVNAY